MSSLPFSYVFGVLVQWESAGFAYLKPKFESWLPQKMVLLRLNLFDVPELGQFGLQDAASPVMEEVIFFHDQIMFILTLILTGVF